MAGSGGSIEQRRRRRREKWLVILGVTLHAVYMLSIFDIYFKSPIVHGMDPVHPNFRAPAKRLVLLVADGLRADKFFESEGPSGKFRAPFLRNIIKERGRWGVSHARPPTESRPGHVSIIAGFYEDPSAVTKGWKANPVEFDSVFNQSRHTISYGSPDIVPIFCSNIQHSTWDTYPYDYEDFATDASFLDHWSLDQFKNLLNKSHTDSKLKQTLAQDKLVIFLHLLGCDTNGHAHKPFSPIYLNNVKVVDSIAKEMYELMESYFNDNGTAYVFTADHGMSDKGSHGDGHPTNTDTPLVAWGAGIKNPKYITLSEEESEISDAHGEHFVDDHEHGHTPDEWGLHGIQRLDVNQADIAPLMATLVGLPCPMNSVGNLPKQYLNLNKEDEVEAVLANTKQILNQFLRKSHLKQQSSLYLKPFKPLENYESALDQIQNLISTKDYDKAIKYTETLRDLALSGLHYYQTYDWLMLMTVITLGYIGWMINLIIHVLQSYALFPKNVYSRKNIESSLSNKVYIGGFILDGIISFILFLEKAPPLYHAYVLMTVLLWTRIMNNFQFIKALFGELTKMPFISHLKLMGVSFFAIFVLEFLVMSFSERRLYTWCFLCFGLFGAIFILFNISKNYYLAVYIWLTCWFLSIFTLMPAEIPENNNLVVSSGALIILIALASKWIELYKNKNSNKFWVYLLKEEKKGTRFSKLFFLQVLLVGLSSIMVSVSTSHRAEKRQLLPLHQLINWFIAGSSMVLPLFSPKIVLSRLTSIFLGFAPPFLLLSIGYEAVFYGVFGLVLMGWILIESASIYSNEKQNSAVSSLGTLIGDADERCLQLSDLRIPLIFMVLFNIAFFGTGNFASIASFEISSVYRFITIFSPFLMSGLLIFKLFIPFILVICAFSAITKIRSVPRLGLYFIVILFSDVMTIHFFFLVRNKGSWMEIGNSISHFGIMSAQVVFVLMLFALTNIFTKDIQISTHRLSRKSI